MRKLISASKRKWVLGGILGFAAVALTTTGFATWIVGVNVTTGTGDVTVTVDTTERAGIKMTVEMTTDNIIELKEPNSSSGVVSVEDNDVVQNALRTVATVTITYGEDFDTTSIDGVSFDLKYEDGSNSKNLIDDEGNKIKDKRTVAKSHAETYWEYIKAPGLIALTDFDTTNDSKNEDAGTYTHTENINVDFTWGSFFDKKAPSKFYNNLFEVGTVTDAQLNAISTELDTMKAVLNNQKLTLTATLTDKVN